jgi:phosphoribosylformimino-5-aminoimidazole carboxamide ribonucleotide (ProFAR) isomerase
MFSVLPAIDLTHGRLGAYSAEGPVPVEAFGGDPVAAARSFVAAGARWLHVVDMDLAFEGTVGNVETVVVIREAFPDVAIQASGGIRTPAEAAAFLSAGAARVVIGSAALGDERGFAEVAAVTGGRYLVGIEIADGRIRSRGREPVDLDLMATLGWLTATGAPGFVVTAVDKVGSASGPDDATVKRVVRAGRPTLAAGGIVSVEDLVAVHRAGAVGAVVGRATLEGSLPLPEALAWAAEH